MLVHFVCFLNWFILAFDERRSNFVTWNSLMVLLCFFYKMWHSKPVDNCNMCDDDGRCCILIIIIKWNCCSLINGICFQLLNSCCLILWIVKFCKVLYWLDTLIRQCRNCIVTSWCFYFYCVLFVKLCEFMF